MHHHMYSSTPALGYPVKVSKMIIMTWPSSLLAPLKLKLYKQGRQYTSLSIWQVVAAAAQKN